MADESGTVLMTSQWSNSIECVAQNLCATLAERESDSLEPISLWFLFGLIIGPYLVLMGVGAWVGGYTAWTSEASTPGTDGYGGFQFPSILMSMGFFGTMIGLVAMIGLWPPLEHNPVFRAVAGTLTVAFIWSLVFGTLIPFLALIWWPIHRVWGPRWYTMLTKEQVKALEDDDKDIMKVGGKAPRPKVKRHYAFLYGRQITPPAKRLYPKAASGHLWAAVEGIYFDPWQRSLTGYRELFTWESMTDVRVLPATQRMKDGAQEFDPNPLNWIRGPKLVIDLENNADNSPQLLQFTLNFRLAKQVKEAIDEERDKVKGEQ